MTDQLDSELSEEFTQALDGLANALREARKTKGIIIVIGPSLASQAAMIQMHLAACELKDAQVVLSEAAIVSKSHFDQFAQAAQQLKASQQELFKLSRFPGCYDLPTFDEQQPRKGRGRNGAGHAHARNRIICKPGYC